MNKRNFLLSVLAVTGLFFTSCSDDDNNNNNSGNNNPDTQELMLFTSSNTSGKISVTNLNDAEAAVLSFDNGSTDADGIYYDNQEDRLIQASRTDNRLNIYSNIRTAIDNNSVGLNISGSSQQGDFNNPREIAVSGNKIFVVQDEALSNLGQNKIVVYERNGAALTLHRTYNVGFKLWGIHADGDDLYAVVDNTGDIVEFDNILTSANGDIVPTKRVTIEGLTRTHGITYSDEDDTMILTDIGSANSDTDGGLVIIENFDDIFEETVNGSIIPLSKQKRIYGAATTLGNPVDVAYDDNTNMIYVAERANSGGRVLTFAFPTSASSNAAPVKARQEAGVSAVYLSRKRN